MQSYIVTFVAGCQDIVLRQLKQMPLNKLKVTNLDESAVTFDSDYPIEKLIELRFFTNIYLIIGEPGGLPKATFKGKYFRLMMLKDGEPSQINPSERANLESKIKQDFGLSPNTHQSKNDFYLIQRTSGQKLLTLRLSRAKFKREGLSSGELRPELAHILLLAAGIRAKDTVLDMFAGYGSIPFEAVRGFGCKQVIAVDNQKLPNRHENPSIKWYKADACNLDFQVDNSVDRIVTDPPWGDYEKSNATELKELYEQFIREVHRVLKQGGVAVILSGSTLLDNIIRHNRSFKVLKVYPILVSGKKAKVFKLQKTEQ